MSNEEGSSSQAVYKQVINVEELKRLSNTVEVLLSCVNNRNVHEDNFSPIYKVPSRLRDVNPSSFTPRVVSIGPLHRGRADLKLMEDKKAIYLYELLDEVAKGSEKEKLTMCEEKVMKSIEKIKTCYFGMNYQQCEYTDDELAQIMVMDACFILQFLNKLKTTDDVLSNNRLRSRSVAVDLVLLENQIPYFVLEDIYHLIFKPFKPKPNLTDMLLDLLERVNPFLEKIKVDNLSYKKTPYHILGLLHEFYQYKNFDPPRIEAIPTAHSAVELHKVGVKFRSNKDMKWPLAMEFEQSLHTLRMPKVLIDNFFEVAMRNLIVYEQYSPVKNYVTSYAMAMDMLAATPADIAKLAESDVIVNHLGSNEKASNMISNICKDVTFPDFYYVESWTSANKYYESYWKKNYGLLKRKYFSTPWKATALIAGVIVFALTIAQFIFRIITFT
ncbi:hypothetical protein L1987_73886 [Smallanthus sonchifolius]|uniref:Uncharacterized protein n=1 Tax=Smallanthus sonchifolius TaxID=185202 RepID=A0ACB9A1I1_9ASTR|nr:hypothetical protein L1987_73886 [Smallanthus sonchifolius]